MSTSEYKKIIDGRVWLDVTDRIEFYLDYVNNFLTVEAMSDHYDLCIEQVIDQVACGRILNAMLYFDKRDLDNN